MHRIKHKTLFIAMLTLLVVFCIMLWLPTKYVFLDTAYDKLYHSVFFCALALLVHASTHLKLLKLFCVISLLGAVLELSQYWFPTRSASWEDLQANLIGAGIGIGIIFLKQKLLDKTA